MAAGFGSMLGSSAGGRWDSPGYVSGIPNPLDSMSSWGMPSSQVDPSALMTDVGNISPLGGGGIGGSNGLGLNMGTARLALGGISTLGSLWAAFNANKLAKEQFSFTKDITNTNLANSIKSYNTTLEDRGRSRAYVEGQDSATAQEYIDKNRLTRSGG